MSYQVLARKWRPRRFSELVGQQHVVTALSNALDNDRLHHAYLFTGTRGVGKTTLARIFAKSLNCEQGVSSTPCGVCSVCREIDEGRFADLLEVDAASRTKVEQTRELLDNVPFAPVQGRYKVYLIDEVHMFSNNSFNALLKTLEEPPPHVKFLLATTDPQKVPPTVLSRCLQFGLQRMVPEQIFDQFKHILAAEKVEFVEPALRLLAQAADGSMRDGLSLLDQSIGFGGGKVTTEQVRQMLGTVDLMQIDQLLSLIAAGDGDALLSLCADLYLNAVDFAAVLKHLTLRLHEIALLKMVAGYAAKRFDDTEKLEALAQLFSEQDIQLYYQIAIVGKDDLLRAPDFRTGFEMLMLRMLAFKPVSSAGQPVAKAPSAPKTSAAVTQQPEPASKSTPQASAPVAVQAAEPEPVSAPAIDESDWSQLAAQLGLVGFSQQLANNCVLLEKNDTMIKLGLDPSCAHVKTAKAENDLIAGLQRYYSPELSVEIRMLAEKQQDTPAQQAVNAQQQLQQNAEQHIQSDSLLNALENEMGANVINGSIKPM